MKTILCATISVLALFACGDSEERSDGDPGGPTYWQDVEPIFHAHCTGCHSEVGIGPFAINSDTASTYAAVIALETGALRMPPWPPSGDTPPLRHARILSSAQIETIAAWASAGAPLGDPARPGEHVEPEVVDIGSPELVFDIGADYVPDPSLLDDYRCFLAETGTAELRVASGYRVTPGNRATVHHVIVALFSGADLPALQSLDEETPDRPGWPCLGGPVPETVQATQVGALGGWVPGVSAVAYLDGTGQVVPTGSLAVVQIHYNLHGGTDPDRTRVEVALVPREETASTIRLSGMTLVARDLYIPAGVASVVHEKALSVAEWRQLRGQPPLPSGTGWLLGAGAHMHLLGTRVTLTRTRGGQVTTLLDIPRWDFHWQGSYSYVDAIEVSNDDILTIRCEHDNSEENRLEHGLAPGLDVTWGEGTTDEMCRGGVQLVDRLP